MGNVSQIHIRPPTRNSCSGLLQLCVEHCSLFNHDRELLKTDLLAKSHGEIWSIFRVGAEGRVIPDKLIQYYESLVGRQRPMSAEQNPHLREYIAEIRDAWEARVILRDLRSRSGLATCSGEVDCVKDPTSLCMRDQHPTCSSHTDSCYLCMPLGHVE
jgi:hypothetical protein